jgi:hypothetical protein
MPSAHSQQPVDLAHLEAFKQEMDDDELVAELIESFLDEGALRMHSLAEADELRDVGRAGAIAHALKGSAANFGAHGLVGLCAELEHLSGDHSVEERSRLVGEVHAEYDRVQTSLQSYLQSLQ